MRKPISVLICLLFLALSLRAEITVPEKMTFCGMEITLNAGARASITDIMKPYTKSPAYFQTIVQRFQLHIDWVEKAFDDENVPRDLTFIGMQESSFRGDAVSSSGAVGYWQMKEPAARAAGLTVNSEVDERKHLYLSSRGAARYFTLCNKDFDNWVYAIIGYNRGPAGALSYIDKKYYGAKSMPITEKTHWYALKAIAHKLMFEEGMRQYSSSMHLEGQVAKAGETLDEIAKRENTTLEKIKPFNHWLKAKKVPAGKDYMVFMEKEGKPKTNTGMPSNHEDTVPTPPRETQKMIEFDRGNRVERNLYGDPDFGVEFIALQEGENLAQLSVKYGVDLSKLVEWNHLRGGSDAHPGQIIYLKKNKKARYHITLPGETLIKIADLHGTTVDKIVKANRFSSSKVTLFAGQKLYLKGKRPANEKIIVLVDPKQPVQEAHPEISNGRNEQKPPLGGGSSSESGKVKYHTVASGESLWKISQKYGVSVEEVKKWNGLNSNDIYPGQRLKILKGN